jgi:dUTP pyrophosphatase
VVDEVPIHLPHYYAADLPAWRTRPATTIYCWEVTRALKLDFELGNAFKYLWRAGRKTDDRLADLKKAREYLNQAIESIEQGSYVPRPPGLSVKQLSPDGMLPLRSSEDAAGLDLYLPRNTMVLAHRVASVPLGIAVEIPYGCEGTIRPRSGWTTRGVVAQLGTIDSDYRGELTVLIANLTEEVAMLQAGERVAQLVISPIEMLDAVEVDALSTTDRGAGGLGSTGR